MPTIDIRGKAGAGGKAPGKGDQANAASDLAEAQRRRSLTETYQRLQRDAMASAETERRNKESESRKERQRIEDAARKEQRRQEIAASQESKAQEKAQREAAKAEAQRQKTQEIENKKKQLGERRAAEKSEREKLKTEQLEIKKKQKVELTEAVKTERQKQKDAQTAARFMMTSAKRQAVDASRAEKEQQRQAALDTRATARGYKSVVRMQKVFERQQKGILNHFGFQNTDVLKNFNGANPPPPPGGGGGGPNSPPGRDHAFEMVAGMDFAGLIPKIAKALGVVAAIAVEIPLIPGQIMRGMLSLAGPAIQFQKNSADVAGAGGFDRRSLYGTLASENGTTKGVEWMNDLMLTPEKVFGSLKSYGIAPRSAGKAIDMSMLFAGQSLMPGFRGLPEGTVEATARQRDSYTSAGGTKGTAGYLAQVAGVMEMAISKGMDRAKVLDNIERSMDTLAKGGAAGISTQGIMDMTARFAGAGTPGGRTGEQAASATAALGSFASNPSANPGAMFMAYSQMGKYGGLRSEKDVKDYIGDENWNSMSPKVRSKMVKDVTDAAADGNSFAAFQIATQVGMGANPGRMVDIVKPALQKALPSYLQPSAMGSFLGGTQNSYAYAAGEGSRAPAGIQVSNELINKSTPTGLGAAENLASQATLAGAQSELENFAPIVRNVTTEMEKLGHTIGTVVKIAEAIHPQPNEPQNFRQWFTGTMPSTKETMPQDRFRQ